MPAPSSPEDRKLVRNEQLKLTATWLNTLGSAAMAVGTLTPATLVALAVEHGAAIDYALIWAGGVWIFVAVGLHLAGRFVLRGLRS